MTTRTTRITSSPISASKGNAFPLINKSAPPLINDLPIPSNLSNIVCSYFSSRAAAYLKFDIINRIGPVSLYLLAFSLPQGSISQSQQSEQQPAFAYRRYLRLLTAIARVGARIVVQPAEIIVIIVVLLVHTAHAHTRSGGRGSPRSIYLRPRGNTQRALRRTELRRAAIEHHRAGGSCRRQSNGRAGSRYSNRGTLHTGAVHRLTTNLVKTLCTDRSYSQHKRPKKKGYAMFHHGICTSSPSRAGLRFCSSTGF